MKIYTKIVFDTHGNVLEEDSFEYEGVVALCGGGKGGSGSTSIEPDKEYNDRLAAIAEAQQQQSQRYEQYWANIQAPFEKAITQSQANLLPYQESSELAKYLREMALSGSMTDLENAQIAAQKYLLPQQTNLASQQMGLQSMLLPEQAKNQYYQMAAQNYLLPQYTNLTSAQIGAQQYLLPQQTGLESALIGQKMALLPGQTKVGNEFYKAALPTSTAVKAGQAMSDVNLGFNASQGSLNRNLARAGVGGNAAIAAQKDLATNRALSLAGAANVGRTAGEQQNFANLAAGMNFIGR